MMIGSGTLALKEAELYFQSDKPKYHFQIVQRIKVYLKKVIIKNGKYEYWKSLKSDQRRTSLHTGGNCIQAGCQQTVHQQLGNGKDFTGYSKLDASE